MNLIAHFWEPNLYQQLHRSVVGRLIERHKQIIKIINVFFFLMLLSSQSHKGLESIFSDQKGTYLCNNQIILRLDQIVSTPKAVGQSTSQFLFKLSKNKLRYKNSLKTLLLPQGEGPVQSPESHFRTEAIFPSVICCMCLQNPVMALLHQVTLKCLRLFPDATYYLLRTFLPYLLILELAGKTNQSRLLD